MLFPRALTGGADPPGYGYLCDARREHASIIFEISQHFLKLCGLF
jgi:hypothetical protein